MRKIKLFITIICVSIIVGCNREEIVTTPEQTITMNDNDRSYGPNFLTNGGLEEWIRPLTIYPRGWWISDENDVFQDWNIIYEGNYSAKMKSKREGHTARLEQDFPVIAGTKIRIRFMFYVKQWNTNGARTYCYFRTSAAQDSTIAISELRQFYTNDEYYIIRGGGYGKSYLPHTLNKWLVFDETIMVPPRAKYFEFGINSYYDNTIYVDDCYIGEEIVSRGEGLNE